jgi:hypothetical protein
MVDQIQQRHGAPVFGQPLNPATVALQPRGDIDHSFLAYIRGACKPVAKWSVESDPGPAPMWIRVRHNSASRPEQGWKLHVSASVWSAEVVLRRALPVLFAANVTFKVAASPTVLARLNKGEGGLSQVGKFITVYPNDDTQAVRLAVALNEATQGLRGPLIASDRALSPNGLVYYRYGAFGRRYIRTPLGEFLLALRTPEGKLMPDRREATYRPPEWASDPFIAAGVTVEQSDGSPLVCDRFLVVAAWQRTPRGAVHLAVDVTMGRRCVLKTAPRDALLALDGRDACDALRHEAAILARLAPDDRFPTVFELVECGNELLLVLEDIESETLQQYVGELISTGRMLSTEQLVTWGRELAAMLATIHSKGFVYRDLKASNIIVTPDERLRLVDFGIAHELVGEARPFGIGTRGYVSPQQAACEPVAVADDIYSLGALLYFLATGAEPTLAPNAFALMNRPLTLLNPTVAPRLANIVAHCLSTERDERFPSMAAVDVALSELGLRTCTQLVHADAQPQLEPETTARAGSFRMARQLGDTLATVAHSGREGDSMWASTHSLGVETQPHDIGIGSAGPVLALAELVAQFGDPRQRGVLKEGAHWLATAPSPPEFFLPGLYVGEAGLGAALLRAGQVLTDGELVAAAAAKGRQIATIPYSSPDLFNGTAGRLRFHLLLWDQTKDPRHLRDAVGAGEALLAGAEEPDSGELYWKIPPGYGGLSGHAYLGYAHGAAGIGDALLDLFEVTGDERFLAAARGAGQWLARLAVPVLEDGSGLDWPSIEGQPPAGAFWCHGATGIGRFFLHAAELDVLPEAITLAVCAAHTTAARARWANPTQCHGLSGNIEFILDVYQRTRDTMYLSEARSLASILKAFATEQDDLLVWPSELPTTFTPDYMVGYAGVAVCLLRLGDPECRPSQLSRRGFRYCVAL